MEKKSQLCKWSKRLSNVFSSSLQQITDEICKEKIIKKGRRDNGDEGNKEKQLNFGGAKYVNRVKRLADDFSCLFLLQVFSRQVVEKEKKENSGKNTRRKGK